MKWLSSSHITPLESMSWILLVTGAYDTLLSSCEYEKTIDVGFQNFRNYRIVQEIVLNLSAKILYE